MLIKNETKNTVLADKAVIANTLLKRMKGLLGEKELARGKALVLEPCNAIHCFFMRFTIDVLFLGKDNRVVKALPEIKPFQFSKIYWGAVKVIELPANTIKSTQTSDGDIITFVNVQSGSTPF
ncbi:MAG: DUF192 domain-containing protein [Candidatus Omnitrophota bacterium]|jgi:hypothetical protein